MKTIKVSEASGSVLDWLVAKCEGYNCEFDDDVSGPWLVPQEGYLHDEKPLSKFKPSTNWSTAGPIIEREHISVEAYSVPNDERIKCFWYASEDKFDAETWDGPTPLIAACRCYVASKMGDVVEVPEELE